MDVRYASRSLWRWMLIVGIAGCHAPREIPTGMPCEVVYKPVCYPLPPVELCDVACPETLAAAAQAGPPVIFDDADMSQMARQPLSLEEAREIALRNNKTIRVLGYVPQEVATEIDIAAAVFDPLVGLNGSGGFSDAQTSNAIQTLGTNSRVQKSAVYGPVDVNQAFVTQFFDTGGSATLGFGTNYNYFNPVGGFALLNPYWQSAVNVGVVQPLFRGRGPEVTQAPIAIARANENQSVQAFQASVQGILKEVELSYWDLVLAYRNLNTSEEVLVQSKFTFEMEQERLRIGDGSVPDAAQAEQLFLAAQIRRSDAERAVALSGYQLRRQLGLPLNDQRALIPNRKPIPTRVDVDWNAAVASAQARPELLAQQAAVRSARVELARSRNLLRPDVGLTFDYAQTGLESNFDHSVSTIGTGNYYTWTTGVLFQQAWGYRAEQAEVRRAELALSRATAAYRDLEHQVLYELQSAYQDMIKTWRVLDLHHRRREVAQIELDSRKELYIQRRTTLDLQLDAEITLAEALLAESAALVAYEQALVNWQYASGVTLCDHIVLAEHERQAAEAIEPPLPQPLREEAPAP